MYEVELKFPLSDGDAVVRELVLCGARAGRIVDQCDLYFNHPARDFERSDEALRIRTVGGEQRVTYKGPVVDAQTKTRREIEIALAGLDSSQQFSEMLRLLGFRPVREVRKRRQVYDLTWHSRPVEVALDDVSGLGQYLEIETLADESTRSNAIQAILALAVRLQLGEPQRKSYLALLIAKDQGKKPEVCP
jgi:adenylate cyclase, class 2